MLFIVSLWSLIITYCVVLWLWQTVFSVQLNESAVFEAYVTFSFSLFFMDFLCSSFPPPVSCHGHSFNEHTYLYLLHYHCIFKFLLHSVLCLLLFVLVHCFVCVSSLGLINHIYIGITIVYLPHPGEWMVQNTRPKNKKIDFAAKFIDSLWVAYSACFSQQLQDKLWYWDHKVSLLHGGQTFTAPLTRDGKRNLERGNPLLSAVSIPADDDALSNTAEPEH